VRGGEAAPAMSTETITTTTTTTVTRRIVKVPKPRPRLVKRVRTIVVRTRTLKAATRPARRKTTEPSMKPAEVLRIETTKPSPAEVHALVVRPRPKLPVRRHP
jgi:hypothetical protein